MPGFFTADKTIITDDNIKECLIFLLCGINSKHLQINYDEANILLINSDIINKNLIKTFESHCIATKNIKRYVCQKNYMTDSFKKIICSYFIERMEEYHKKVLECQTKELEEIYTTLSPMITEFNEYYFLINNIDILSSYEVLNFIYERQSKIKNFFYEKLIWYIEMQIEEMVLDWVVLGHCHANFFIKKNTSILEFDESEWKNSYKIIDAPPSFVKKYIKEIYNAGLYINMANKLNVDIRVKEYRDLKMYTLEENVLFYHKNYIQNFQMLIGTKLNETLKEYQKIYFLKNTSELTDVYDYLQNKIFEPLENKIDKINSLSATKYKLCDTRINHYMLKILNVSKDTCVGKRNAIENLCIAKTNKEVDMFFSKEFFFELEIIHRFLMQMFTLDYIYNRSNKNRFTQNVLLFLYNLRTSLYTCLFDDYENKNTTNVTENTTFCVEEYNHTSYDVDSLVTKYVKHIKNCLKEFYLTNSNVFQLFSDIFDLFISYIYLAENEDQYFKQFILYMHQLAIEMRKCCTDFTLVFYLENFTKMYNH